MLRRSQKKDKMRSTARQYGSGDVQSAGDLLTDRRCVYRGVNGSQVTQDLKGLGEVFLIPFRSCRGQQYDMTEGCSQIFVRLRAVPSPVWWEFSG